MAAVDLADDVRSDADLVVSWAIEAIDGDRLDLAAELIILARRLRHGAMSGAAVAPAVAVPLRGATRDDQPRPVTDGSIDGYRCIAPGPYARGGCLRPIRRIGGVWVHNDPEILDHDADPGPQAD